MKGYNKILADDKGDGESFQKCTLLCVYGYFLFLRDCMKSPFLKKILVPALFLAVVYFPLFLHLDWEPVHNWDESLFAMRAGYMTEEGRYLLNYSDWVENGPLHPNTKPPFTTWIQVLFMKILGVNELALRLPIALFALAIVISFILFSKKQLGNVVIGYCAGFVLVTSPGFIHPHAVRTGDQDVALAFYMLAGALVFYKYIKATTGRERNKWVVLLTFLLIISALTKYVFGLFFLPAFFIYAIYKRELIPLLRRGSTWLAVLAFLLLVGSWFLIMENRIPGFAHRVLFYEMIDRYTTVLEMHEAPWYYYFVNLWESLFVPWILLLPIAIRMIFLKKNQELRDFLVLMLLCAVCLLTIVSFSQSKLTHYEIVSYPPLAFLAGAGMYRSLSFLRDVFQVKSYRFTVAVLGALFVGFFMVKPYLFVLDKVYKPRITQPEMMYGYLLKKMEKTHPDLKSFELLHSGFDGQAVFYAGQFNRKKGYHILLGINPEKVEIGEIVATCDQRSAQYILEKFEVKAMESYGEKCFLVEITGLKEDDKLPDSEALPDAQD